MLYHLRESNREGWEHGLCLLLAGDGFRAPLATKSIPHFDHAAGEKLCGHSPMPISMASKQHAIPCPGTAPLSSIRSRSPQPQTHNNNLSRLSMPPSIPNSHPAIHAALPPHYPHPSTPHHPAPYFKCLPIPPPPRAKPTFPLKQSQKLELINSSPLSPCFPQTPALSPFLLPLLPRRIRGLERFTPTSSKTPRGKMI